MVVHAELFVVLVNPVRDDVGEPLGLEQVLNFVQPVVEIMDLCGNLLHHRPCGVTDAKQHVELRALHVDLEFFVGNGGSGVGAGILQPPTVNDQ